MCINSFVLAQYLEQPSIAVKDVQSLVQFLPITSPPYCRASSRSCGREALAPPLGARRAVAVSFVTRRELTRSGVTPRTPDKE